jgi:hypothetical protein
MQIHGLTLEFEVHASKQRLRWKKKQYATCALDSTSPKEGGERFADGICVGFEPICHFLKVYFGPTNFYYYF